MLTLDHLTVIAPSLEQGLAHVRQQLGIDVPPGGKHPEMGTHNHLLRLGDDVFLEVIAVDPGAQPPTHPRWFGLDAVDAIADAWANGDRLRGWVTRTRDLTTLLARHGKILGQSTRVSRGDRSWQISIPDDGSLPGQGAAPTAIDWGDRGCPASAMADLGCRLQSFTIEHPQPAFVRQLYTELGVVNPPIVEEGARLRYRATIATPAGVRDLE